MTQKQPILCEIITTLIPLKWNEKRKGESMEFGK